MLCHCVPRVSERVRHSRRGQTPVALSLVLIIMSLKNSLTPMHRHVYVDTIDIISLDTAIEIYYVH